jgi:hypothetical protein
MEDIAALIGLIGDAYNEVLLNVETFDSLVAPAVCSAAPDLAQKLPQSRVLKACTTPRPTVGRVLGDGPGRAGVGPCGAAGSVPCGLSRAPAPVR